MSGLDGQPYRGTQSDGVIDSSRLMHALNARKGAILIPTMLAAAAALALVIAVPARYASVAKLLLENQESYLNKADKSVGDAAPNLDDTAIQSAAESLATPDIARKAIDKLELDRRAEFHPSAVERIIGTMFAGARSGAYDDVAVETFLNRLSVFPVSHTRVLQIEFSSQDPVLAARVANTVAGLYLDQQVDAQNGEAKTAADWLSSRIEPLRAKVAQLDQQIETLRAKSGLLAGANGMTTSTQRLAELTTQVAAARNTLAAGNAKATSLRDFLSSGRAEAIPEVARDESLRRYLEARVALKSQIAEASRTLLSEHPRMRELQGQLSGLDDEIHAAAAKSVQAYENDARIAAGQVRDLEQSINEQTRAVAATDPEAVRLNALELDAKSARDQLESYLQKYREALARESASAAPPNARIIETASASASPSFPKRGPTIVLATLAGFVLSLGVAVARVLAAEGSQPRPMTPEEAYQSALATALGPTTRSRGAPQPGAPEMPWGLQSAPESPPPSASAPATALAPASLQQAASRNAPNLSMPTEPPAGYAPPAPVPQAWLDEAATKPPMLRQRLQLPGASPVLVTDRDPTGNFITPESQGVLTGAAEHLLSYAPQGPLTILVTGEGARGALSAALGVGRRFAKKGETVLFDLGLSQPWLGDVVTPGAHGFAGLSHVIAGQVSFESALHHDLSSRLDIMPLGAQEVHPEPLEKALEQLGERYPFVILHAADWRTPVGRQALQFADGALVCANPARIAPIRSGVARAVGARQFILVDLALEKGELSENAA